MHQFAIKWFPWTGYPVTKVSTPILTTLCMLLITIAAPAETIIQNFTNKSDFSAFWNISTWGNAEQQYAAANVQLDTVNGWVK